MDPSEQIVRLGPFMSILALLFERMGVYPDGGNQNSNMNIYFFSVFFRRAFNYEILQRAFILSLCSPVVTIGRRGMCELSW